jgi:hypothetical protein
MTPGTFKDWKTAFGECVERPAVAESLKAAALRPDLRAWTRDLTTAVVQSCTALGWRAAGRGNRLDLLPQPGQEYLGIDVMAFPGRPEAGRWPFPVAAFELENHPKDDRVAYALWKVLCLRVSLRVVFAYRADWEQGRRLVTAMATEVIGGLRPEQRADLDGQTVLVVGNRGEGETFPWGYFKSWMLNPNLGNFEKL